MPVTDGVPVLVRVLGGLWVPVRGPVIDWLGVCVPDGVEAGVNRAVTDPVTDAVTVAETEGLPLDVIVNVPVRLGVLTEDNVELGVAVFVRLGVGTCEAV